MKKIFFKFFLEKKVIKWSKKRGIFKKGDVYTQTLKLYEEINEFEHEIIKKDFLKAKTELGDIIFVVVNICRMLNISLLSALYLAYKKNKNRKGKMINGTFVKQTDKNDIDISGFNRP